MAGKADTQIRPSLDTLPGYTGQILRVDLSNGKSWVEDTKPYAGRFLGGKGINIKIIFDEVDPTVKPYDAENRLCFGPGALTGTLAPSHSRMKVTTISPNGLLQNSGIGGYFPAALRKAGYDNLTIQGKSNDPVYLLIDNDRVEIRDARHLWGMDTQKTQRMLKDELGKDFKIACIGPAGENLVRFSAIVTGKGSAAGRGGMGTIMGSKKLKAIAARGSREIRTADPQKFFDACTEAIQWLREASEPIVMQGKDGNGDKYTLETLLSLGLGQIGNWEETDASWDKVGDYNGAEEFYRECADPLQYGCYNCPVHHFHIFNIPGKGRGTTKCTQWECFSHPTWISDRKVFVYLNTLCQDLGLDSTGTCNAVSFLMELYKRNIISEKQTGGIAIRRGDPDVIEDLIKKIGLQEGVGKLFKDGVLNAAKTIGPDAEECAVVVNDQEMEPFEFRPIKSWGLGAALTDGTIAHSEGWTDVYWITNKPAIEEQAKKLYGNAESGKVLSYAGKADIVNLHENIYTAGDLTGACKWLWTWMVTHSLEVPAKLYSLATGTKTTEEDLHQAARRTYTLERACRSARGLRRDTLPERLFTAKVPDGVFKGERMEREGFNRMLDDYYSLRGWDKEGIPKEETFKKHDLSGEWKTFKEYLKKGVVRDA